MDRGRGFSHGGLVSSSPGVGLWAGGRPGWWCKVTRGLDAVGRLPDRRRVGTAVDAHLLGLARGTRGFRAARRGGRGSPTRSPLGDYQMRRWSESVPSASPHLQRDVFPFFEGYTFDQARCASARAHAAPRERPVDAVVGRDGQPTPLRAKSARPGPQHVLNINNPRGGLRVAALYLAASSTTTTRRTDGARRACAFRSLAPRRAPSTAQHVFVGGASKSDDAFMRESPPRWRG